MNLKNIFNRLKNRIKLGKKQKLLESPKMQEDDILHNSKIENIINNMPQGLSKIEKSILYLSRTWKKT